MNLSQNILFLKRAKLTNNNAYKKIYIIKISSCFTVVFCLILAFKKQMILYEIFIYIVAPYALYEKY